MKDLEIKSLTLSKMVSDLTIYDNNFAKFVLQSLRQCVKGEYDCKNELFVSHKDEVNDFKIYIIKKINNSVTVLLPEEY